MGKTDLECSTSNFHLYFTYGGFERCTAVNRELTITLDISSFCVIASYLSGVQTPVNLHVIGHFSDLFFILQRTIHMKNGRMKEIRSSQKAIPAYPEQCFTGIIGLVFEMLDRKNLNQFLVGNRIFFLTSLRSYINL